MMRIEDLAQEVMVGLNIKLVRKRLFPDKDEFQDTMFTWKNTRKTK